MNVSCVFSLTRYEVCRRLPSVARRKTRWPSILVIFTAFGSFSMAANQAEGLARSTSIETPAVIQQAIGDNAKTNPRTEVSAAEFYDTLNVDTLDDEDEIIGSDGTLRLEPDDSINPDSKNVHDVLELIEDGRLYPILSKDETSEYTPRSDTNDFTTKNNDVFNEADDEKNDNDKFEQSDAKRRKGDDIGNKNNKRKTVVDRAKREAANLQPPRKVKTGDTILNIHGSVKDAITDLGSSNLDNISRPRNQNGETSHIDTIVIHPSQYLNKDLDETVSVAKLSERRVVVKEETNDTLEAKKVKALKLGESDVFKAKNKDVEPPDKTKFKEIFTEKQARLVLDCDLPRNVTVNSWTKDGHAVLLGPGQSLRVRWAADTRGLLITRAAREDDGRWACEGRDTNGRLQRSTPYNLLVYEESRPPYLELDGRRLDAGNTWAPAREGVVLDVLCVSEGGQPAAELSWAIVGGRAEDLLRHLSVHSLNYTTGSSASRARLAVGRAHHNATLECRAAQRRPRAPPTMRRAALQLDVAYPPSFTISRTPGFGRTLVTGNAATLHCAVDSNPPARAAWRHGDAAVAAGARLQFAALGAEHAGWYRCVARYGETDYTSIGYYLSVRADVGDSEPAPPASSASKPTPAPSPPQLVDVELGGTVQLHCPKGSVGCWTKKQHTLDESKRDEKGTGTGRRTNNGTKDVWVPAGSQHAHGVLGVAGALYQQAGEYRCVGASADDAQRLRELRRLTLRVIGSPAVYARAVRPAGGGGARLAAQVCARPLPARVLWLLQDRALSPGSQLPHYRALALQPSDAPDCWEAELIAGPGAPSSEVWLVARNDRGVADAVFRPAPRNRALAASTASTMSTLSSAAILILSAVAVLVFPT